MPDTPDVIEALRNLPPAAPASPDIVAADLERGHRAVTARRRRRLALSGAAAAVITVVAVGAVRFGPPATSPPPTASGTSSATVRLTLVDYLGDQPVGFKVTTVPQGWTVTSSDPSAFVVAPPGVTVASPRPGAPVSVQHQIMVSLRASTTFPAQTSTEEVDVNGRPGRIGHPLASATELSDTTWLMFPDDAGHTVQVQVPASTNLTESQIVRFAGGITVTGQARPIGG